MSTEKDRKIPGASTHEETGAKDSGNTPAGSPKKNDKVIAAHEQAEADIEKDPDFSMHSPNDDLDEGETARLGEDLTGII